MPGLVAVEDMVGDPGTARLLQELGVEADQTARGHHVLQADATAAMVDGLRHAPLAERQKLRDDPNVVLRDVDGERLDRLVQPAVDLARNDLGAAGGELEALAPQRLDEDRELQLAATLDDPGIRALGVLHAQRDVADQLGVEPAFEHPRRELAALATRQRRGVDADQHRKARLVDGG